MKPSESAGGRIGTLNSTLPPITRRAPRSLGTQGHCRGESINELGAQISNGVAETRLVPNSIATRVIQAGVNSGEITRSVGISATTGRSVVGKVASVATAVGIGLEGGFAAACR